MNNSTRLLMPFVMILLAAHCIGAQEGTTQAQAGTTPADTGQTNPATELIPDTRPVTGAEEMQVESPARSRNFAIPSLRVSAFGDSNQSIVSSGTTGFELNGSVIGNLAVHRVTRRNNFSLDYSGGGIFYARQSEYNSSLHQVGITESYTGRRWGITLGDQLSYLPESPFGFGGFGSSWGMGGDFANWNPNLNQGQTLYSGRGRRIANSALMQLQYTPSARSTFTFAGSFGMLRFQEPGLLESNSAFASMGYNYALSRRDTISFSYGYAAIRFVGSPFHVNDHYAGISYSRRVTGRLAFSMSGGPQFVITGDPSSGNRTRVGWGAHTSLDYSLGGTGLGWSYSHYTSNGSGIFLGAKTDYVSGSLSRRISRNWNWSMGPGYSRNAWLGDGPVLTPALAYNSIYASTSLNRSLGRYTDLGFSYTLQEQWSDAPSPSSINQGSSYLRHFFGMGLTWHAPRIGMN